MDQLTHQGEADMRTLALMAATVVGAAVLFSSGAFAAGQSSQSKVKVLDQPVDASKEKHGVLIGRAKAGGMLIQLELEFGHDMWMLMGNPAKWQVHPQLPGELYHVEVKPIDPKSKTRIPYADLTFAAINKDTGKKVKCSLHAMWGGSGLHYACNNGLAGDGTYEATVTVGVPTFARGMDDIRWMEPATGKFHFKLSGGKLTEVSEPED
ncbi:MAG: iron transporter [Kiloniellales bacterium]